MAGKRTQKQISARYKDNLSNYKRLYGWRRAGAAISLLTLIGGALAIWYYYKQAPDKFFNPGPVSKHHQNISRAMIGDVTPDQMSKTGASGSCDACHAVIHIPDDLAVAEAAVLLGHPEIAGIHEPDELRRLVIDPDA